MEELNSDYVILSLTETGHLQQWDAKTGGLYSDLKLEFYNDEDLINSDTILEALYCSNGKKIALLGNRNIYIIDSSSGKELIDYRISLLWEDENEEGIQMQGEGVAMSIAADANHIAIGVDYNSVEPPLNEDDDFSEVIVYNIETGHINGDENSYYCNSVGIEFLKISPNGRYLLVILDDSCEFYDFEMINEETNQYVEMSSANGIIKTCNFSMDNRMLLCGNELNGIIEIFDTNIIVDDDGELALNMLYRFENVFTTSISHCEFLNNNNTILACSVGAGIKLLNLENNSTILDIDVEEKLSIKEFDKYYNRASIPALSSDDLINLNIIVSKYDGFNSCDKCIISSDKKMIITSVHNHSMGDGSIICIFDVDSGELLRILEEFPIPSHVLSLNMKPIDYGLKRESSSSLLRSLMIDETSSAIETLNVLIKNAKRDENIKILEDSKNKLLEAQENRISKRSRPSTPVEMVFGDQHKREELMDYIHPKAIRPDPKNQYGGNLKNMHKRLVYLGSLRNNK
tara:strand:- start:468 stop:2018 length:1551 start_codon:yes stop_codon:yes gene_type:complete